MIPSSLFGCSVCCAPLREAVKLANTVAPNKPSIEILASVQLTADPEGNTLSVSATNLDQCLSIPVAPNWKDEPAVTDLSRGTLAVNGRELYRVLQTFDKSDVLTLAGVVGHENTLTHLRITCEAFSARLEAFDTDQRPAAPDLAAREAVPCFGLADTFPADLSRIATTITTETTRYALNGFLLRSGIDGLVLCSTDGHRLSLVVYGNERDPDEATTVIVEQGAVKPILAGLKAHGLPTVTLYAPEWTVWTFPNGVELIARGIEGKFPRYAKVIPQDNHVRCRVEPSELYGAVKKLLPLLQTPSRTLAMRLEPQSNGGPAMILASTRDTTHAEMRVAVENVSHSMKPMAWSVNGDYLANLLKTAGKAPGALEIALREQETQGLFTFAELPQYRSVIMPMRV